MDIVVPFDEEATCDLCGLKGAYDLMGDIICDRCLTPTCDSCEHCDCCDE